MRELAGRMRGLDYTAAGVAVSRFSRRLAKDAKLAGMIARIENMVPVAAAASLCDRSH